MESRKVLGAARPPVGEGPPTRAVLAGLRRLRPPLPVLVGVALMSLVPLALLGVAGYVASRVLGGDAPVLLRAVAAVPAVGLPLLLSALAWRGTKRALHAGQYAEGLFVARLTTMACVVIGGFLLWWVYQEGHAQEGSMAVPFVVLAVVWLPAAFLALPAAKAWPDRVLLRRGIAVADAAEAQVVAAARAHSCGTTPPLGPHRLVPVADDSGTGWALDWRCETCGRPVDLLLRQAGPGERSGVGGGDWVYLAQQGDEAARVDPATAPDDQLPLLHFRAAAAVQATEGNLALIPPGKDAVPAWRRTGRPVPLTAPPVEFSRPVLERRLAERRAVLARVEHEVARRSAGPQG
jgi:hypothetical protein